MGDSDFQPLCMYALHDHLRIVGELSTIIGPNCGILLWCAARGNMLKSAFIRNSITLGQDLG